MSQKPQATASTLTPDEELKQLIDDFFDLAVYWHTWRLMLLPEFKYRARLESVATDFLRTSTNSLFESIVSGLVRLTDKSRKGPVLTVSRVLRAHGINEANAATAMAAVNELNTLCDYLADNFRNTRIAHNNLLAAEERHRSPASRTIPLGTIDAAFQNSIKLLTELERLKLPTQQTFFAAAERLARASLDALMSGLK